MKVAFSNISGIDCKISNYVGFVSWEYYWSLRGFSPESSPDDIVEILNDALVNYDHVKIITPGIYEINSSIYIPNNTILEFCAGCTLKKSTGSEFSHMIINDGILTGKRNENISLIGNGLIVDANGIDKQGTIESRLKGQIQFYKVDGLDVSGLYHLSDDITNQFFLCLCDCTDFTIDDIDITSEKDGIDILSSSDGAISNIVADTGDDGIFVGIGYPGNTPVVKSCKNISIENYDDDSPIAGYGVRIYCAAWGDWTNGRTYKSYEYCLNDGKLYGRANNGDFVAANAPIHTSGKVTGADGIAWWFIQNETEYGADVDGLTIKNMTENCNRYIAQLGQVPNSKEFYQNGKIDNVVFDNLSLPEYTGSGIKLEGNINKFKIINSDITISSGRGLFYRTSSVTTPAHVEEFTIEDCTIDASAASATYVSGSLITNFTWNDFVFTDCELKFSALKGYIIDVGIASQIRNITALRTIFTDMERFIKPSAASVIDSIISTSYCEFVSCKYLCSITEDNNTIHFIGDHNIYSEPTNYLFYNDQNGSTLDINVTNSSGIVTSTKVRNNILVNVIACDLSYITHEEYQSVYDSFINKPSSADIDIQSIWMKGMVEAGYYAKAELLDMFSVHTNNGVEGCKNWKSPGTFDPSMVNTPAFEAYAGFTGIPTGDNCIRLNFIPSVDGTLIGQNNICAIIGIGSSDPDNLYDFGAMDDNAYFLIAGETGGNTNFYCNDKQASIIAVDPNEIAHFAMSRNFSTHYYKHKNYVRSSAAPDSTGFVSKELYACGRNNNDTIIANLRQVRYVFLFSYLLEEEVNSVIALTEAYLDNYGKGLIS